MVRVELDGAAEQVLAPGGVRGKVGGRGLLQQKRRAPRFADQRLVERIGIGFVPGQAIGDSNHPAAVLDSTQRCVGVPEQSEGGPEPRRFPGDVLQYRPRTVRVALHHGEAGEAESRVGGDRSAGRAHGLDRLRRFPRLSERQGAAPGLGGALVASGLELRLAEPPPGRAELGGGGGGLSQSGDQPAGVAPCALRQRTVVRPAPGVAAQLFGDCIGTVRLVVEHVGVIRDAERPDRLAGRGAGSRGAIRRAQMFLHGRRLVREIGKRRQLRLVRGPPHLGAPGVESRAHGRRDGGPCQPTAPPRP